MNAVFREKPLSDFIGFMAAKNDPAKAAQHLLHHLRHIAELRPQIVKLDVELVRNVHRDPAREALIAGMVHFAAASGCDLIAEGIETAAERRALMRLGVVYGQGYLLGRPAPASELG